MATDPPNGAPPADAPPPERHILCGGVPATGLPAGGPDPVRLWLRGPDRNVHRRIEDVLRAVYADVPPVLLDLFDLACYVYAADQAVVRGGGGVEDCGDGWRRHLAFRVPVREPDFWNARPVREALVPTLSFLSEDEYRFEFVPPLERDRLPRRLDFTGTAYDGLVDEVVMFSGGLDSLAGAVQEAVADRRKVLLVNHRSNEKVTPRHTELVRNLCGRAGPTAPFHTRVRVNKDKPLGRAFTQRTRSFLFTAVGATFAATIGLDRLRFYENGVVSLNLPLSAQVVGARASRTTHPRVLAGYSQLLTLVTGKPFTVENRFLWKTKADVVRLVADAGCGDLIGRSVSCAHTWAQTREHPHCGACSQCVDRRFAVLAAGQADHDPGAAYGVDLLTGPRPKGKERVLLAAYLETANQVERMADVQFFGRFMGEVSRAVPHVPGHPDGVARQVLELYRRHARDVNGVIERAIGEQSRAIRTRDLPDTCLLRLVYDAGERAAGDGPSTDPKPPCPGAENLFRRWGQVWAVRFAGGADFILLPGKGPSYLHALLARPGTEVPALELVRQGMGQSQRPLGSAGEHLDHDARVNYLARIAEVRGELDKAREDNDPGRVDKLAEELEALIGEVRRATAVGGRLRRAADGRERARKAVSMAIHRTIRDIREDDPALADHLTRHLQCGASPLYSPDPGVRWET